MRQRLHCVTCGGNVCLTLPFTEATCDDNDLCDYSCRNGYGDANDNWVNARRIWNQHQYHVTNVNDDGTIPPAVTGACQEQSWLTHNTYRQQPPPAGSAVRGETTTTAQWRRSRTIPMTSIV